MKRITKELDKIASGVETNEKLSPSDRLAIARMIDEVSDNIDTIEKSALWLMGDQDEEKFMKRYDEAGAYQFDEDEKKYMGDYENPPEVRAVFEEYERKHKPGYETKDLNTDVHGS